MTSHNPDPFSVNGSQPADQDTLSEWDFFVPAKDADGHSVRFNLYIQPGHRRQISILKASGRFPYKTEGDLVRHLIKRGIDWLLSLYPNDDRLSEVVSIARQVDMIMELVKGEEFQQDFQRTFDSIAPRVAEYLVEGHVDQARGLVSRMANLIADMPEGYWQTKYKVELIKRFGHILQLPPPPPLNLSELLEDQ